MLLSTSLVTAQLGNCDIQSPTRDARCCTPYGDSLQDGTPCGFYYQCLSGSCEYKGKQGELSINCNLLNALRDSECCFFDSELMDKTSCGDGFECESGKCIEKEEQVSTQIPIKIPNPCEPNDPLRDARCCTPSGHVFQDGTQCGNYYQCNSGSCEWTGLISPPSQSCNISFTERDSNCCYYSDELKNGTKCGDEKYCFGGTCNNSTESLPITQSPSTEIPSTDLPSSNVRKTALWGCTTEDKACEDQRLGEVCFDPRKYQCVTDSYNGKKKVCHQPDGSCSGLCFNSKSYRCKEGKLMIKQ